jgi:hypothetical protein
MTTDRSNGLADAQSATRQPDFQPLPFGRPVGLPITLDQMIQLAVDPALVISTT